MKVRKSWRLPEELRDFKSRLTPKRGRARGTDVPEGVRSNSVPEPSTSVTSATDMEPSVTRTPNLWSSIFAAAIPPSSSEFTVWTMSPIGYVEQGCPPITIGDAKALTESEESKLRTLAEGRGESVEDAIRAIVEFYVDSQDGMQEATLLEAVRHYLDNYVYA